MILMLCCLFWGGNFVVGAWALGQNGVPPFMLAAIRAIFVLLIMGLFLTRPRPEKFGRLLLVCACVGPIHLGFLYTGLITAPASGSSIVSQMMIPFATILSVVFLKERVGWVRGLGMLGAFIGTVIMIYEPGEFGFNIGLVYIVMAYISLAIGSILMKTVGNVDWRIYVTWMAAMVLPVMGVASILFEPSLGQIWTQAKWPLLAASIYAALCVTIFAHGQYFKLIGKYEVSLVVPLTLMTPVFATVLGIGLLGERLSGQVIWGAVLILPCVYIIARRQSHIAAESDLCEED